MSDRFSDSDRDNDAARQAMSALADGEAQGPELARACAAWRDQPDARLAWRDYQMIGDVMRSEDLAQASSGDAFLSKFRERLAQEPVVLAPSAAQAAHVQRATSLKQASAVVHPLKRRAWAGPMAVAAGFVMVVGALMSSQILPGGVGSNAGDVAVAQTGGGSLMPSPGGVANAYMPTQWTGGLVAESGRASGLSIGSGASFNRPADAVIIRDPRLDQALAVDHVGPSAESSFAGQGELIRPVVFDGH
jgi:sigma-E factor negative regulatory protein RseA